MLIETFTFLATWTPFLLQGFFWNVFIAVQAVLLGTLLGAGLAWVRVTRPGKPAMIAERFSKLMRGVPTLALIFYAVFVLPTEFTLPGTATVVYFPQWIKAVIGLAAAPLAFTSESLVVGYRSWSKGDIGAALLFIPTWINAFLISFVASSASSLVGVSELVSRCNFLIAATGSKVMIPVYLYCSLYFVVTALLFTSMIRWFKESKYMHALHQKLAAAHAAQTRRNLDLPAVS
ncbi:ABC transporter permease [Noviherbaspirillum galbum]|uniref:Polar amino acid ABC transporter permease n=1 Tax=Noviherbaspirillum galbum TaxID=2709383 RepID=A0A6B3SWB2_9BURK|nr:polar amino acid ABC transporter permease [Noviherbaspirillum galbum]NEX64791.1 polar amino acid ABC transporter permease [Noviherbaspirillum galbum]